MLSLGIDSTTCALVLRVAAYAGCKSQDCSFLCLLHRSARPVMRGEQVSNLEPVLGGDISMGMFQYQTAIMLTILANFACECTLAQIKATEESHRVFELANIMFTVLFCLELLVNMFSTLVKEFVNDWWNWFDVLIVTLSLADLLLTELTTVREVRMTRIFRGKSFFSCSVTG